MSLAQDIIDWAGLDSDQVAQVKKQQADKGEEFARAAMSCKVISEAQYRDFMAHTLALPAVEPHLLHVSDKILETMDIKSMQKYRMVPFYIKGRNLYLACFEPDNMPALDDIRFMTGLTPLPHAATLSSINEFLHSKVSSESQEDFGDIEDALADMGEDDVEFDSGEESDDASSLEDASQAPVVKMVNLIIKDAIRKKTSDIHIEPYEKDFRVRFRLDGMLKEVMRPPLRLKNAMISRLKIMARLNIAEKRVPQDGRIKVKTPAGKEMEFRVSILPTLFGEKVVMRLLDKSALKVDMTQLGLEKEALEKITDAIQKPYGMFLVTGPTGSGKTTTLYSVIMELNQEGVNISTAEDPVEFSLKGVNQVQVMEEVGLTFPAALRSFLRQDPDIILVGEIRDLETAQIAVKSALTGHLVLSTLHTNDAPSTLTRLLNMGVDDFLVASSVNAIVAQRLIRRLCPICKRRVDIEKEKLINMGMSEELAEKSEVYEPVGCDECNQIGYKGRAGVYEILVVTEDIQSLILRHATVIEIRDKALEQGMLTMRQSGLLKISRGDTTIDEILRTTA